MNPVASGREPAWRRFGEPGISEYQYGTRRGGVAVQDPDQLAAKAADAVAQRDAVQANLLELEGSFGKRLLAGASLTGRTGPRWDVAATTLADLWQTFTAYSAVVDRIAELAHGGRRMSQKDLPELTELLTGRAVPLTRAPAPLARRDLAHTRRP